MKKESKEAYENRIRILLDLLFTTRKQLDTANNRIRELEKEKLK